MNGKMHRSPFELHLKSVKSKMFGMVLHDTLIFAQKIMFEGNFSETKRKKMLKYSREFQNNKPFSLFKMDSQADLLTSKSKIFENVQKYWYTK